MQPIDSFAGWWRNDVRLNSLTPKISLKTKTRAIFALLLILFAAVAAYAFMELSAISRQAESSKTVWEARIVAANAILRDAQNYRIAEALRLLPSSPEMAAQADDDLKANAEGMEQSIAAYRAQLHPQEAQTQINKAKELWGEYLSGNRIMLEYADGGDAEAAVDRFRNSASGFYLVADAAEANDGTEAGQEAEAYAQSLKISERARWGLIGGVAFVICFLAIKYSAVKRASIASQIDVTMMTVIISSVTIVNTGRPKVIRAALRAIVRMRLSVWICISGPM